MVRFSKNEKAFGITSKQTENILIFHSGNTLTTLGAIYDVFKRP